MSTRRFDSRIIELDDLNPTKYQGSVLKTREVLRTLLYGFGTYSLYYCRMPHVIPFVLIGGAYEQQKYYKEYIDTSVLRKKQHKDGAWNDCADLSWPRPLWAKKTLFWFQAIFPFIIGGLAARRLFYRHLSPAFPRPPTPAPKPTTPKSLKNTLVH